MVQRGKLTKIPDVKAMTIGHYTLTATGLEVAGRPSFDEHEGVGEFIRRSHQASGWWLAEWLAYGKTRADWKQRAAQLVDAGVYREKTLQNLEYLRANVTSSHRREDVDISLHFEVAALTPKEQDTWLEKAATEQLSRSELRKEIRAAARRKVIEGQAILEGMYRVLLVDCPWLYSDSGATKDGSLGKAERHYPGMTIEDLCKLPVEAHSLPNSIMFFWVTATMLYENPGPREVIEAWGFTPKTGRVWDKVLGMHGHYASHVSHEHLIICTRGSCLPDVPIPEADSVFVERRGEHSAKPESVRKWIEQHWTTGPYLELFARAPREGWSVFGNDARLWAEEARSA